MTENELISQMLFNLLMGFPAHECCKKECKKEEKKEPEPIKKKNLCNDYKFGFDICPKDKHDETSKFVVDLDEDNTPAMECTKENIKKTVNNEPYDPIKWPKADLKVDNVDYLKVLNDTEKSEDGCSCSCHLDASPIYCITTDNYRLLQSLKNTEVRDELKAIVKEAILELMQKLLKNER